MYLHIMEKEPEAGYGFPAREREPRTGVKREKRSAFDFFVLGMLCVWERFLTGGCRSSGPGTACPCAGMAVAGCLRFRVMFLFPPVLLRRPGPRRPPCGRNGHGPPMRPRNLTLLPVAPLHA